MDIYLPIAEMSVNVLVVIGIGGVVGWLSGMFGVGGGFLMTPLLFFFGIPPAVAVASGANQIAGASVSGLAGHWRRGNVDVKMAAVMLAGGAFGSLAGVWLFQLLRSVGQIDLVISLAYVLFLGSIGVIMAFESLSAILRVKRRAQRRLHQHNWMHGLPLKMRFRRSKLYISALPPIGIGVVTGVLAALMGVGGGFVLIPAMIYLLGMPTSIVIGTSLLQIVVVTAVTTVLHAWTNQTVDVVLAILLLVGGVVGAQFGSRLALRLPGEYVRGMLSLLVLAVGAKVAYDLVVTPAEVYAVAVTVGG